MDDDLLLEALGRVLDVDPVPDDPAPERVAALRSAVEAAAASQGGSRPEPPMSSATGRSRWPVAIASAAALALAFLAGTIVAGRPPGPVRTVAHALGLPVDSQDLLDARDELDRLGSALAAAAIAEDAGVLDSAHLAAIADADAAMLDEIRGLDDDERPQITPVAHQVHLRAVAFFAQRDAALPTATPGDLHELESGP